MMALIGLIILPSIAAFWILTSCPIWSFKFYKQSAEKLILIVISLGIVLNLVSATIIIAIKWASTYSPWLYKVSFTFGDAVRSLIHHALPSAIALNSATIVTMLIAVVFSVGCRLWRKFWNEHYTTVVEEKRVAANDEEGLLLERLFSFSVKNFAPLMINLKGGKVYIGWVVNPSKDQRAISIFLIASGYRDPKNKAFVLTNNYQAVIAEIEAGEIDEGFAEALDIGHIIMRDEIVSATPWLAELYEKVKPKKKLFS